LVQFFFQGLTHGRTTTSGSPSNDFSSSHIVYTSQKKLISVQPLSLLKDIRLGIDGNVWLRKIISGAASELYLPGIGGTPSGIRMAIEKELEGFK
jgi:hypothetical protein